MQPRSSSAFVPAACPSSTRCGMSHGASGGSGCVTRPACGWTWFSRSSRRPDTGTTTSRLKPLGRLCGMNSILYTTWRSPIGELLLAGDEHALRALHLPNRHARGPGWTEADAPFARAVEQLEQYFAGERTAFELPLAARGTRFDEAVWDALSEIPYGETRSYGEVAQAIGRPDRARAVGSANARNPLAIIVPCHRVIGSDGSLTGYGGGLERKRALLALEATGGWQESLL